MTVTQEMRDLFAGFSALQRAQSDLMMQILGAARSDSFALRAPRRYEAAAPKLPAMSAADRRIVGRMADGAKRTAAAGDGLDYSRLRHHPHSLTAREVEVLKLVVEGNPNKKIARELGISPRTVELHRTHAREKLQARNGPDLVRRVWELLGA
jgi:DNA-binding CsgD family transcriptional regulator